MPAIRNGKTGCKSVGSTASLLMSSKANMPIYGVKVKAPRSNTAPVFIGFASTITADTTEGTAGWIIESGTEDFIPCDNPDQLYVIAASTQPLYWWIQ